VGGADDEVGLRADFRFRQRDQTDGQLVIAEAQGLRQGDELFAWIAFAKFRQMEGVVLQIPVFPADSKLDRGARPIGRHAQGDGFGVFANHYRGPEQGMGGTRGFLLAQRHQNQASRFLGGNVLSAPSIDVLGLNSIVWNSGVLIQPPSVAIRRWGVGGTVFWLGEAQRLSEQNLMLAKTRARMLSNSALLAAGGGFLDGFTYVGHGHVFANAMTGNVVLLGINFISGSWDTAFRHLPPIVAFLLGISAAKAIQLPSIERRLRDPQMAALMLEIGILFILSWLPQGASDFAITTSIAFAASVQVGTFRDVNGRNYNSTFVTGNLRTLSEAAFDWCLGVNRPEAARVARDFATICVAFLLGATAGGYSTGRFGNRALWCDIVVLVVVAIRVRPR